MDKKSIETLLNPIIMKIVIVMLEKEQVTTKDILDVVNVPQATLYRYIAKMQKNNIIEVVKEEYKRGSYEKTYQLKYDPIRELGKIGAEGTVEEKQSLFLMFMMNIMNQFNQYVERDNSDLIKDQTGFRTYPLYLSPKENQEFIQGFGELLQKYISNDANEDRLLYSFSFVHVKGE